MAVNKLSIFFAMFATLFNFPARIEAVTPKEAKKKWLKGK